MRRHALAVTACFAMLLVGPSVRTIPAAEDRGAGKKEADGDLFGLTRVIPLDIEITAEEYRAMQPPMPAGGPGAPPPAPRPKRPGDRDSERNLFGVTFPWVARGLHHGRQDVPDRRPSIRGECHLHGVRRRPEAPVQGRSRPVDHLDFHGLRAIDLQAGALDPTRPREVLAYASSGRRAFPRPGQRSPR